MILLSGAITGSTRRGRLGTPKNDTCTGPSRSTMQVSVFFAFWITRLPARNGMEAIKRSGSKSTFPKKSKSTDGRWPRYSVIAVPPYRTNSFGTSMSSSRKQRCGGRSMCRRGENIAVMGLIVEPYGSRGSTRSAFGVIGRAFPVAVRASRGCAPIGAGSVTAWAFTL